MSERSDRARQLVYQYAALVAADAEWETMQEVRREYRLVTLGDRRDLPNFDYGYWLEAFDGALDAIIDGHVFGDTPEAVETIARSVETLELELEARGI